VMCADGLRLNAECFGGRCADGQVVLVGEWLIGARGSGGIAESGRGRPVRRYAGGGQSATGWACLVCVMGGSVVMVLSSLLREFGRLGDSESNGGLTRRDDGFQTVMRGVGVCLDPVDSRA